MVLPHETRTHLKSEGEDAPEDVADFDEDSISKISNNLKRIGGRVLVMTSGDVEGATSSMNPFTFGEKSQAHLTVAHDLVRFYEAVGRDAAPTNTLWGTDVKKFQH